jgi:hypothetical protein
LLHVCVSCEQRSFEKLVTIQIHKRDSLVAELLREAAFEQNQFRIPLRSRSFAHAHAFGAETTEALDGGKNQQRMSIDVASRNVVHEIGLKQNRLPSNIQMEKVQSLAQ